MLAGSTGIGLATRSGLMVPLMGPEKDFLRPKNRDNRPPDELVELEADIAVDVMDAGAAGAAVEDAVVEAAILIGVSFGEGGWMEARFCAKAFLPDNVDESTEPVPRPRLGLRKMLLPKLDLSRSVLLVPVEDEAGGKTDLVFVLFLLKSVVEYSGVDDGAS